MPISYPTSSRRSLPIAAMGALLTALVLWFVLPATASAAGADSSDAPLPSRPFSQQLETLNGQQNILERYRIDHLSRQRIEVTLWYTGDYRLDPEEVKAFTNGACFGMLRQAFEAGLRPYRDKTRIVCHARQQDGDAVSAHALGSSRYSAGDSDEFVFEAE